MKLDFILKVVGGSLLSLTPFLSADAAPLTPDQALRRLEGSNARFRIPGNASYRLAYTENADQKPRLYVFNKGNDGFVIASADDRLPALLGYSDNGAFNPSEVSPELKWWLSQYADEASFYLCGSNGAASAESGSFPSKASRANIPELLTTKWNQDAPYNLDCPEDGYGRSVTGCVATAMAQVIKYHSYPTQGTGQHSYNWNGKTLTFDYGATTFDYADMLDEYDDSATPSQQAAVAALMYACGVGVEMDYSSYESGASDMYIPYALKTYFNYDSGTRLLKRNCFTSDEWEDLVYEELAANRPVIYGGQAPNGGHQFVCDGYKDGYYHINWGWAGLGDGYFLLSSLDPGQEGIGGFAGGYNSDQAMVYGAKPSSGSNNEAWYPIYATGSLSVGGIDYGTSQVVLVIKNGGVYNFSPESVDLSFCLKCVSETGDEYKSETPTVYNFAGAKGLNYTGYNMLTIGLPSNLEAGNYRTSICFQTPEGNWQDILFPLSDVSYLNLNVAADGSFSFTDGEPVEKTKIRVTEFVPTSTVLSGNPTRFDITVENIGVVEFSGVITAKVYAKESHTEALATNHLRFNLAAGEVFNGYVALTYSLPDGEYDLIVYDQYDEVVSDVFTLRIGEASVVISGITLDKVEANMQVDTTLQLTATVMPEDASDKSLIWSSSNPEIANVDQTGLVTAFTPGKVMITATSAAIESIAASCDVTVVDNVIEASGIMLDRSEATLTEGETLTLTATVDPETTTDKTLTWSSSNESVAKVEAGLVTALKSGTSIITVSTSNGKTATCEVTVKAKVVEADGVALDRSEATLTEGETLTLTATVDPENTTDKTLTWSSSDESVAKVEAGLVTALKPGAAIITVSTSNGKTATCEVTVKAKDGDAEGIILDVTVAILTEGDTIVLTATVEPEGVEDDGLTWSSSDEEVATVADGVVTALKSGIAMITVSTTNGKTATCEVIVNEKVIEADGVALDMSEATLTEGETLRLTATVDPETTTDNTLTWSSSDESVATVTDGVVTALNPGTAIISVSTSNGKTASCEVTVIAEEPDIIYVTSVSLDHTDIRAIPGVSVLLIATVLPEDATDKTLIWSSTDEDVATVDQTGLVTIHQVGSTIITATTTDGSDIKAE